MKPRHALLALAAAAVAAPAAFAQATVTSSTVADASVVTITPSNSPVSQRPIRGAVIAEAPGHEPVTVVSAANNTAVMGAAPAPLVQYWWNVPKNIDQRDDFRRWRGLQ
jgi:hypothetical protein